MTSYAFRCSEHGNFAEERPMRLAAAPAVCFCGQPAARVFNASFQFRNGRETFHDGPEHDGRTVRETAEDWRRRFREDTGRDPDPMGSRWI